jgi:hypothetical protein
VSEPARYLRALALSFAALLGLFVLFTGIIDPYGVSPIHLELPGINTLKPKRVDIDRLIKPYEVWRYQPRTIFLGTSRAHQSLDPSVLDGTRFAPAYNASMPAGSMEMNAAYLRQYVGLDRNLHTVIIELFLPSFIGAASSFKVGTWSEFASNTVTLFASANTLWDSIATVAYNAASGRPTFQIEPRGYLYRPPGRETQGPFDRFASYIWSSQVSEPDKATFNEAAFAAILDIFEIARSNGLELIFLLGPSHGYADYYYDSIGAWGVIEEWLMRLSGRATVYSFSQPNDWVNEPISPRMTYWYDTFHYSLAMGRNMLTTLAGVPTFGLPDNFMERLTPGPGGLPCRASARCGEALGTSQSFIRDALRRSASEMARYRGYSLTRPTARVRGPGGHHSPRRIDRSSVRLTPQHG